MDHFAVRKPPVLWSTDDIMPFYANTEQFYTCTKALFARIAQRNPHAGDAIHRSRLSIHFRVRQPEAEILIDGRHNPVQTSFGPSPVKPELDIELDADTLHRIMLGELRITAALGGGLLKVNGPAWKTAMLGELFHQAQKYYPQVLREQGLTG
jgi:hypothetical protein